MITNNYVNKINRKVCLVVSEGHSGFEIQTGELADPKSFIKDHTILIDKDRPNLLWDLLHHTVGIPYPQLEPLKPPPVEFEEPTVLEPPPEPIPKQPIPESVSPLEEELRKMEAKDIVKKVEVEKGILITNSLKSKKTIIAKALKIYSQN